MNTRKLFILLAALLVTSAAYAGDNDRSTSTVTNGNLMIPYDGYLALDGTPMNGQLNLQFDLYDVDNGGTPVWTETQSGVSFYNGRFSVALGSVTPVTNVILDAERVYLAISIDDGTGTFFPLSGRQAIEPTPYAAWSASAADFKVEGNLDVEGNITGQQHIEAKGKLIVNANDNLNSTSLAQFGKGTMDSQDNKGLFNFVAGAIADSSNNQEYLYMPANNSVGVRGATRLRFHDDTAERFQILISTLVGGAPTANTRVSWVEAMRIDHDANVTIPNGDVSVPAGGLSTSGDISTGGNLTVTGDLNVTGNIITRHPAVASNYYEAHWQGSIDETRMISTDRSVCFLVRAEAEGLNSDNEGARCFINVNNGDWNLVANGTNLGSSGSDFTCWARCISW